MPRRPATGAEFLAIAEANGYKRGVHEEQDQVADQRTQPEDEEKSRCHAKTLHTLAPRTPRT